MSQLLPEGIEHLGDAPFTLHAAIIQALRILGYEKVDFDERPPRRIWFDEDGLEAHWKEVERKRKVKFKVNVDVDEDEDAPGEPEFNGFELIKRG